MSYEEQYLEIIRLYQQHRDLETVAKMMNDKGVSYREVEAIIIKFRNQQRKGFLIGGLASLTGGGLIVAINLLMAVGIHGIFPILTAMGVGLILIGVWCLYRAVVPR